MIFQNILVEDIQKLLNSIDTKVETEESQSLEQRKTTEELEQAISSINSHKTPDLNGLGAQFYQIASKTFANILSSHSFQLATPDRTATTESNQIRKSL